MDRTCIPRGASKLKFKAERHTYEATQNNKVEPHIGEYHKERKEQSIN
jgi:hypothetical protein